MPLYPADATPAMVADCPAESPCASGGGDGDEKTVFGCAGGAGGNRDGGGLRCAGGAGGDIYDYVFVDGGGAGAGSALADAIEIGVVILARKIVAGAAVADGQVFPAEKRGGVGVGIVGEAAGDAAERSGRDFFVENSVGVESHGAQRGGRRLVRFYVVDGGIAGERSEERLQTGAGFHAAVAEDNVLAIGRDAVREIGGGHVGNQAAEDFDGGVVGAGCGHLLTLYIKV